MSPPTEATSQSLKYRLPARSNTITIIATIRSVAVVKARISFSIALASIFTLAMIKKFQLRLQIGDLLHQVGLLGGDILNGRAKLRHHAPPN